MAKVSIIIPVYNRAQIVRSAIDSAINQTYQDTEIIVIDDGSTDNCQEVLSDYGNKIRIIQQENGGAGKARNTGIKASSGEYICFLDSDDSFLPEKISRQAAYLDSHPSVDVVVCGHYNITTTLKNEVIERVFTDVPTDNLLLKILWSGSQGLFPPMVAMIRREMIDKAGFFDETLKVREEQDFWMRMAISGAVFGLVPEALCIYNNSPFSKGKNYKVLENTMETIYANVFANPALPSEIKKLENEIYARTYLHIARYYLEEPPYNENPDLDNVIYFIKKAFQKPEFVPLWSEDTLIQFVYVFIALHPEDPVAGLHTILDFIPADHPVFTFLQSRIHIIQAFSAYSEKDDKRVIKLMGKAIREDYHLISHPGIVPTIIRSALHIHK